MKLMLYVRQAEGGGGPHVPPPRHDDVNQHPPRTPKVAVGSCDAAVFTKSPPLSSGTGLGEPV